MYNKLKLLPVFLLILFILSFLIHTNSTLNQDLGRHIKLGEIILKSRSIPDTNLFTYTNSNYPFINHHWLSEVIFYLFYKNFGFLSISLLKVFVLFFAASLVFAASKKVSSLMIATVSCFFIFPLLMSRTDERPEIFGFLFFCVFLALYFHQRTSKKIKKITYGLPLIQLLWINTHITFVFGFLLLAIFIIDQIVLSKNGGAKPWLFLAICSVLLSFLNPHGLQGLLYPFSIFKNYGYSIQENQNLFFLSELTSNIYIKMFWIQSLVIILMGIISLFYDISKNNLKKNAIYYVLFLLFFFASIIAIRNFPFFVFISALSLSYFIRRVIEAFSKYHVRYAKLFFYGTPVILGGFIIAAILYVTSNTFYKTFDQPKRFELKVKEDYKGGTEFFLKNNLKGPILNNFDIGGYLDYRLYPETKMFVDNRPEAYPTKFFDYYKNALTDIRLINKLLEEHRIETIIVSHTDGTPWAREFIKNTTSLHGYKFIYVDHSTIILSKTTQLSTNVLENLERLIDRQHDYQYLLSLSNLASLLGSRELSQRALNKAFLDNPFSCTIKLQKAITDLSSEYEFIRRRGLNLLKSTGMCPYPKDIKRELKTIKAQF